MGIGGHGVLRGCDGALQGMSAPSPALGSASVIDGRIVDTATGECLGLAVPPAFVADTQETVEWVLEKMLVLDSEIAGLEARRAALVENMDAMIGGARTRRRSLERRFKAEVIEFARANLGEGKRTWRCPFGSVSFRTVPGSLKVVDEDLAVRVAESLDMGNAVKVTKKVLVTDLTDGQAAEIVDLVEKRMVTDAFEVVPERESVTIRTGVAG